MKIFLLNLTFLITVLNTVADKTKRIGILGEKQLGEMCESDDDCMQGFDCVEDSCNVSLCRKIVTNEKDCDGKLYICPNNEKCVISECGNKCVPNTPPGCGDPCDINSPCSETGACNHCDAEKKICVQEIPCGDPCKATIPEHQEFVKCKNFNGFKCHCHNDKIGIETPSFRCEMNCNDEGCEVNPDPNKDVCDKKCRCTNVGGKNICKRPKI